MSKKTANKIGNSSFETPSNALSVGPASSHARIEKNCKKLFVKILLVYSKSIVDFISVIILA
jgi:hypothetical protein